MKMHGKVVLITGAASDIGRAVSRMFADEGALVYAADRMQPQPAHPYGVEELRLDVTSECDWARSVAAIIDENGRLDVLINHAGSLGLQPGDPMGPFHIETWMKQIATVQAGAFLGMREAAHAMRQLKAGSIVNVSPPWARTGMAAAQAIQATHGALREMSKHAAKAYAADGIRVNVVLLGFGDARPAGTPVIKFNGAVEASASGMDGNLPAEVADACLFLSSEPLSRVSGAELLLGSDAESG